MEIENPDARATTLSALEALADFDGIRGAQRAVAFDNITAEAGWLFDDDGDIADQLGIVLYAAEEVTALRGPRAALDCLYDLLGRESTWDDVVNHPYFIAVMTSAAHAAEVMKRYEP